MDKTYTQLVSHRDLTIATIAGLMDADTPESVAAEIVAWDTAVCECKTSTAVLQMAGTIPEGLKGLSRELNIRDGVTNPSGKPVLVQGMTAAFALLTAQQAVVGYVPTTKPAKEAALMVKANKSGGLYVAKAGHFSLNLPSVACLMLLEKAIPDIKAALSMALLDAGDAQFETVTEPIPSANGMSHKFRRVAKCGGFTIGDECHSDAVVEWLS